MKLPVMYAVAGVLAVMILAGCDTGSNGGGNGSSSKTAAGGACLVDDDCADTLICVLVSGGLECSAAGDGSAGSVCGDSSHCDYACMSGLCSDGMAGTGCSTDSHCADGLACSAGACKVAAGGACVADDNCAAGLMCPSNVNICTDGSAGSVCGDSSHCDYACVSNVCTDGMVGADCFDDSDCTSGVCNSNLQCQ